MNSLARRDHFIFSSCSKSDFTLKKGFFVKRLTVMADMQQNLCDSVSLRHGETSVEQNDSEQRS